MTLILSLGNADQFIQLSDRRLTANKEPTTEEWNKGIILRCSDARMVVGFAGIAAIGRFSVSHWILNALKDCAPPDYTIGGILGRFLEKATRDFQELEPIRSQPRKQKRLSIMFSGYLDVEDPPRAIGAILSNYQDFEILRDSKESWDEFRIQRFREKRPLAGEMTFVQRIGAWQAMTNNDIASLRRLLKERKPAKAIVGKGVSTIRKMAARPRARGLIGQQVSSIWLPRSSLEITTDYHTTVAKYRSFMPSIANLVSDDLCSVVWGIEFEKVKHSGPPVALPIVHPKAPCPCGSGRKYRECHGGRYAQDQTGSMIIDLGKGDG